MTEIIREKGIEVVILTSGRRGQVSADKAVAAGTVRDPHFCDHGDIVPEEVLVYRVDISVELEKLLFFLKGVWPKCAGPWPGSVPLLSCHDRMFSAKRIL